MWWCGKCKRELDAFTPVCPQCGQKQKNRPIIAVVCLFLPVFLSCVFAIATSSEPFVAEHKGLISNLFGISFVSKPFGFAGYMFYLFTLERHQPKDFLYVPLFLALMVVDVLLLLSLVHIR